AVDTLRHFRHKHPLTLVYLPQPTHKKENVDDEDEDEHEVEDEVEFVEEDHQCNLCEEQIWSFHLCYYSCKTCDYSLHKFCAELTDTLQNHPLHPGHTLKFFSSGSEFNCAVCRLMKKDSIPRVCGKKFYSHLWIYKCDKCRYYVHVDCATSKREPFMSIFITTSLGKTSKNFKEDEHPNLLHCPFQDEGDNLVKCYMSNQQKLIGNTKQPDGEMIIRNSHQHPLRLFDKQTSGSVSLHDPMKRTQFLCDGCVKPIMSIPFYTCCQDGDEQCCFVLHEWCAKLPPQVQDYAGHPEHTLVLLPKIPGKFFGVFECDVCWLPSNGFSYGCTKCDYYVDINCAFIPKEITHDSHPNHLLSIMKPSIELEEFCKACKWQIHRRN
ncbi:hypothetical protein M8C21_009402, partial [Ambrosia artemisiifolia]